MELKYIIASFIRGICAHLRPKLISIHGISDIDVSVMEIMDVSLSGGIDLEQAPDSLERGRAVCKEIHAVLQSQDYLTKIEKKVGIRIQDTLYLITDFPERVPGDSDARVCDKSDARVCDTSDARVCNKSDARVCNKIVLVTGAAQGFGLGISEALVERGATVIITDINEARLYSSADDINQQYGEGSVRPILMDCSDEHSITSAVRGVLQQTGGIDILVSNAGIVKSGGVENLEIDAFMKSTEINYVGYFLLVKYFSEIMISHFWANNNSYYDIIQINSKSGLVGSNKNSAYAGSKFGGIGLTQSFALELIAYNIKVNAICPGNFYDGPLWSDPETGLFKQYLDAKKIEGATSIEDVKHAYLSKSPIKRGCTVDDVMKAILYVIEQTYETGQALPVTGGQVMLR